MLSKYVIPWPLPSRPWERSRGKRRDAAAYGETSSRGSDAPRTAQTEPTGLCLHYSTHPPFVALPFVFEIFTMGGYTLYWIHVDDEYTLNFNSLVLFWVFCNFNITHRSIYKRVLYALIWVGSSTRLFVLLTIFVLRFVFCNLFNNILFSLWYKT